MRVFVDEQLGSPFPVETRKCTMAQASDPSLWPYQNDVEAILKSLHAILGFSDSRKNMTTLEVGCGVNPYVSWYLSYKGHNASTIDRLILLDGKIEYRNSVPFYWRLDGGVNQYVGLAQKMHDEGSALKDARFDSVIFWASLEEASRNSIGGVAMEYARDRNPEIDALGSKNAAGNARREVIERARAALNPEGGILIVSPRFAFYGCGFTTRGLPYEQEIYQQNISLLESLGAKNFFVFGVSSDGVKKDLTWDWACVADELISISRNGPVPQIARMDAVYARF